MHFILKAIPGRCGCEADRSPSQCWGPCPVAEKGGEMWGEAAVHVSNKGGLDPGGDPAGEGRGCP